MVPFRPTASRSTAPSRLRISRPSPVTYSSNVSPVTPPFPSLGRDTHPAPSSPILHLQTGPTNPGHNQRRRRASHQRARLPPRRIRDVPRPGIRGSTARDGQQNGLGVGMSWRLGDPARA